MIHKQSNFFRRNLYVLSYVIVFLYDESLTWNYMYGMNVIRTAWRNRALLGWLPRAIVIANTS